MDTETLVTELQARIAHQDNTIAQLNDVIVAQQKQMDRLEASMNKLAERLIDGDGGAAPSTGDEIPPHY